MAVSQTDPRTMRRLTETAFCVWLGQAYPNEALEYHCGLLVLDASHDSRASRIVPASGPSWLTADRHDLGLVNGMFVTLDDIQDVDRLSFSATLSTEDGMTIAGRHRFYKGHYDDHVELDAERARRDWRDMRNLIETVWGYAITGHKAQGSQWPNVIVYDNGLGRTAEDRSRWLYTAITRADRGLVLLD